MFGYIIKHRRSKGISSFFQFLAAPTSGGLAWLGASTKDSAALGCNVERSATVYLRVARKQSVQGVRTRWVKAGVAVCGPAVPVETRWTLIVHGWLLSDPGGTGLAVA